MKRNSRVPEMPRSSADALVCWVNQLFFGGLLFNPDDRPEDVVEIATGSPVFSPEECQLLNRSLHQLFGRYGDEVRDVALKYLHKAMGITPEYSNP